MPTSYNGWPASPDPAAINVGPFKVARRRFPAGVKQGDVEVVLRYLARNFHKRVEKLVDGWCWGYNYRATTGGTSLSCHASGTAIDINAPRHPYGKGGTFTAAQVKEIRKILAELDGTVRWGGDFDNPDEMHFEIRVGKARVAAMADEIRQLYTLRARIRRAADAIKALGFPVKES